MILCKTYVNNFGYQIQFSDKLKLLIMNNKSFLNNVLILSMFLSLSVVSAQSITPFDPSTSTSTPTKAITLATVNIYNATSTQKDNTLTISFDITNRVGVQPGVKYGIVLTKDNKGSQTVIDEYVSPETLNLGENSSIHKVVTYTVPANIFGTYSVWISSKNNSGFPFGLSSVGNVTLKSSNMGFVSIIPESCFLTVKDEKGSPHYNALQGVDISSNENLIGHCTIENTTASSVALLPSFITHLHSTYGETVKQLGGDIQPLTILSKEKKTIEFELPKAEKAQSYDVSFALKNTNSTTNSVDFRYILRGASATIQNILLDKDSYKKGDIC